jgi:hypothetical protein
VAATENTIRRLRLGHGVRPVDVPIRVQVDLEHVALQDDAAFGLENSQIDRGVEKRLVVDDPPTSIPHEAVITILGFAWLMRFASSVAAKPPKTTEWIAPMRAHASIAMTASGTIGM